MADESISIVKYRKYLESSEDIYPALTICFKEPFYEDKLKEYKVDVPVYVKMLSGENIRKYQEEKSDDAFDLFGPEEPVIPEENVTRKLYSTPFEEVSFVLERDRFRSQTNLNIKNMGNI